MTCEHCGGIYRLGKTLQDDIHGLEYCDGCGKSKPYEQKPRLECEHGQLARSCDICQLTKERDEARDEVLQLKGETASLQNEVGMRIKERDEALALVQDTLADSAKFCLERDEARAALESCNRARQAAEAELESARKVIAHLVSSMDIMVSDSVAIERLHLLNSAMLAHHAAWPTK